MSVIVPTVVERLLTADVAEEIAQAFTDQVVYPARVVVDDPQTPSRRFPGWPGPVLVLADENQGVCSWGVPLGGNSTPPVVVGGDLLDAGQETVPYAASVEDYIAARRWDRKCMSGVAGLQAQAVELDRLTLASLQAWFAPAVATAGWPWPRQYRFEGHDARILLWSGAGQCDWSISASSEQSLMAVAARLLDLSDLRQSLYPSNDAGERVLDELRALSH